MPVAQVAVINFRSTMPHGEIEIRQIFEFESSDASN